jgi:hypothetical protein
MSHRLGGVELYTFLTLQILASLDGVTTACMMPSCVVLYACFSKTYPSLNFKGFLTRLQRGCLKNELIRPVLYTLTGFLKELFLNSVDKKSPFESKMINLSYILNQHLYVEYVHEL